MMTSKILVHLFSHPQIMFVQIAIDIDFLFLNIEKNTKCKINRVNMIISPIEIKKCC